MTAQEFRIRRNGEFVGQVRAVGLLSALVRFGQLNGRVDANAEWDVERLTHGDGPQTVDSNLLKHHPESVPPDRKGSQ